MILKNEPVFFTGDLPFNNPKEAIEFVKKSSSELPFLPQLPEANPQEDRIAQVLRAIEIKGLDETTNCCLELFQNEFVDSPRIKIQFAGPFAVARTLSADFVPVADEWIGFWRGLVRQLKQAGFSKELWLQIDEPFWSAERELPKEYFEFLGKVRAERSNLKLGIHSVNKSRPIPTQTILMLLDFFSINFIETQMTASEMDFWSSALQKNDLQLIEGRILPSVAVKNSHALFFPKFNKKVWISAPNGLDGWTDAEITKTFGTC